MDIIDLWHSILLWLIFTINWCPSQWKKNNRSSTLSIFHSQRTPFSCFPRVLRYVRAAQQILEPEDNDATSDSELQSSDSDDPDDSEDDAQSDSSEMGDFIEHSYEVLFVPDTDVECITVQSK